MALSESMFRQLRRLAVERRPEACVGCGLEHDCSIRGCRVVKMAVEELERKEDTGDAADISAL